MYELTVFTCSRALVTPVPAAAFDRVNGMEPSVVDELLHRIVLVEVDVAGARIRGVADAGGVAQPERVVQELSPDEAPLGDVALREQVLVHVVEDAVADRRAFGPGIGALRPSAYRAGATRA